VLRGLRAGAGLARGDNAAPAPAPGTRPPEGMGMGMGTGGGVRGAGPGPAMLAVRVRHGGLVWSTWMHVVMVGISVQKRAGLVGHTKRRAHLPCCCGAARPGSGLVPPVRKGQCSIPRNHCRLWPSRPQPPRRLVAKEALP
jgi:hypothetical protein